MYLSVKTVRARRYFDTLVCRHQSVDYILASCFLLAARRRSRGSVLEISGVSMCRWPRKENYEYEFMHRARVDS